MNETTKKIIIPNTEVIETPNHSVIARLHVLPESVPGALRPHLDFPYLSPSQINKYTRCSASYMFSYRKRLYEPMDSARFFGSAVHEAGESYLHTKRMLTRINRPLDHEKLKKYALNRALLYISSKIKTDMIWKRQWSKGPFETELSLVSNLHHGVEAMANEVWAKINPLEIERGYLLEWKNDKILPILGYLDVAQIQIEDPTKAEVIDFKTGKEKKETDVSIDPALSFYAEAYEIHSGIPTPTVSYTSYVRNKKPLIIKVPGTRTEMNIIKLYNNAKGMTLALQANIFMQVNDGSKCGSCAFFAPCQTEYGTLNNMKEPQKLS